MEVKKGVGSEIECYMLIEEMGPEKEAFLWCIHQIKTLALSELVLSVTRWTGSLMARG